MLRPGVLKSPGVWYTEQSIQEQEDKIILPIGTYKTATIILLVLRLVAAVTAILFGLWCLGWI